jgi:hypothetical protein
VPKLVDQSVVKEAYNVDNQEIVSVGIVETQKKQMEKRGFGNPLGLASIYRGKKISNSQFIQYKFRRKTEFMMPQRAKVAFAKMNCESETGHQITLKSI